mmetsp:Transcript_73037/g.237510  ORF Transcript_73037/g.237510 Transcript_73037/m.237510 type:complete len:557 (+) Transcript_73037:127-1797(+)
MQHVDLLNRLLFPTPASTYKVDDFPDELIFIPRSLSADDAPPKECVPCLLLQSPSARFIVLYLHSNAEDLGRSYAFCSVLRAQFQVHVLAVEYPGYGICPGIANEESVKKNAFLAFEFLLKVLKWPQDEIIILGRSIGCGPATAIAAQNRVYGLILICPFLSVRELCREYIGRAADMVNERFPNSEHIQEVGSPLLVVHGKADSVVPWSHGKKLYELCRARKRLVAPDNMKHNSNLHTDPSFFVLPMLHFFGLPDYKFEDLEVPPWLFDRRLSPSYHEPQEERGVNACGRCVPCAASPTSAPLRVEIHAVPAVPHLQNPSRRRLDDKSGFGPQPTKIRVGQPLGGDPPPPPSGPDALPGPAPGNAGGAGDVEDEEEDDDDEDAELNDGSRFLRRHMYEVACALQQNASEADEVGEEVGPCRDIDSCCLELIQQLVEDREELPAPPEDVGFFKVPRSAANGPGPVKLLLLSPGRIAACSDRPSVGAARRGRPSVATARVPQVASPCSPGSPRESTPSPKRMAPVAGFPGGADSLGTRPPRASMSDAPASERAGRFLG